MLFQRMRSQSVVVSNQRYVGQGFVCRIRPPEPITRRVQSPLHAVGVVPVSTNWKVKYTVPITYPNNQSDQIQLAWECNESSTEPDETPLITQMLRRGLLVGRQPEPLEEEQTSTYVRLEWSASGHGDRWTMMIQLAFNVDSTRYMDATAYRARLLNTPDGTAHAHFATPETPECRGGSGLAGIRGSHRKSGMEIGD